MNWQALREKLRHPNVTLGLLIALQLSRSLTKSYPWLVYPRLAINIWIVDSLVFRSRAEGAKPRFGLPWRFVAYVVGLLLFVGVIVYNDTPRHWAEQTSPQPLQAIATVGDAAEVLLGCDELTIYQENGYIVGTISYYTSNGLAVGMAHAVPDFEINPFSIALRRPGFVDRQTAQAVANDDLGLVLKLNHLPDQQMQKLPIGGAADTTVGEEAHLYSVTGGSFPVRILGYTLRKGIQYLVIQPLDRANAIIRGMSGSPIVQNGKLIACASAIPIFPYRGPKIGFARLAADIYASSSQLAAP